MSRGEIKRKQPIDEGSFVMRAKCFTVEDGFEWSFCDIWEPIEKAVKVKNKEVLPPYLVPKKFTSRKHLKRNPGETDGMRYYDPTQDTTLFAKFGDIATTEEAFLEWAGKYGRLFSGGQKIETPIGETFLIAMAKIDNNEYFPILTESLAFWCKEQTDLSVGVRLWEAMNEPNIDSLRKMVTLTDEGHSVDVWHFDKTITNEIDGYSIMSEEYREEKGIKPFWFKSNRAQSSWPRGLVDSRALPIDERMKAATYNFLMDFINHKLHKYPLEIRLGILDTDNTETTGYQFIAETTSLLSCMYWQFAQAVMGKMQLRRCDICGEWEDMATHRSDWRQHAYCSNKQRVMKHREKLKSKEGK